MLSFNFHSFRATLRNIMFILVAVFPARASAQNWDALGGGFSWIVYATTVYNGELIAGGSFTNAGPNNASYIARWDGTNWQPLGVGLSGEVRALTVYNGKLIAGGSFVDAGTLNVNFVAQWNGASWSDMSGGVNSIVSALCVLNNKLYVGGYFTDADGIPANYIVKWNGNAWSLLGTGMGGSQGQVMALATYNNQLIAGGFFTTAGGTAASHIARWDGTNWNAMGAGIGGIVYALTNHNSQLVAGGLFSSAGGTAASGVAKWDGTNWNAIPSNTVNLNYVMSVGTYQGQLLAGLYFQTNTNPGGTALYYHDGNGWQSFGGGVTTGGTAIMVNSITAEGNDLYLGGLFGNAGGVGVGNIAHYVTATGLGEQSANESAVLYPQPADQAITIETKSDIASLTIYTVNGLRLSSAGLSTPTIRGYTLNTQSLPAGIYVVEAEQSNGEVSRYKFIVAHD